LAHAEATAVRGDRDLDRIYELNGLYHAGVVQAAGGGASLTGVVSSRVHSVVLHRTLHTFDDLAVERSSRHHLEIVTAMRTRAPRGGGCVLRSPLPAAGAALLGPRPHPGPAPPAPAPL